MSTLHNPAWDARFRVAYAEARSLEDCARRMACSIWAARAARDRLGLERRPKGRPADTHTDDGWQPPRCPYPDLPFRRGAFVDFDWSDVEAVRRRAG